MCEVEPDLLAFSAEMVRWAVRRFNEDDEWAASEVERGCAFFLTTDGEVVAGDVVASANKFELRIYEHGPTLDRVRENPDRYIGDLHTHTWMPSWVQQLPSPGDLSDVSVFFDIWNDPDGRSLRPPRVQVVQSLISGDCVVLLPRKGRARFPDVATQAAAADKIDCALRLWHANAEATGGQPEVAATGEEALVALSPMLEAFKTVVHERVVAMYVEAASVTPP